MGGGSERRKRARSRPARERWVGLLGGVLLAVTLASVSAADGPVLDALFPEGRITERLEGLLKRGAPDGAQAFKAIELGRDAHTSHHLVWIRDSEVAHRHDRHDLVVVVLRGYGAMLLGDEERAVTEGSILYVPRGTVHAFRNLSGAPAAAYAVYAPAFDGRDRVEVDAAEPVPAAP